MGGGGGDGGEVGGSRGRRRDGQTERQQGKAVDRKRCWLVVVVGAGAAWRLKSLPRTGGKGHQSPVSSPVSREKADLWSGQTMVPSPREPWSRGVPRCGHTLATLGCCGLLGGRGERWVNEGGEGRV